MMQEIDVLAIGGSPRKDGNTSLLLAKFLEGSSAEGGRVSRIDLVDYTIAPCRECLACFSDGNCILGDDMQQIYPRLLASDIIVFASPIFFYGVTGWAKAMIDRSQALWARKYVLKVSPSATETGKRWGYFISVGGTRGQKVFEGAILTVKYFYDTLDATYAGELLFRGIDAKGDIEKEPGALDSAYELGRRAVCELREKRGG